ncbi:HAD family phosphatase [Naasia sp. SYSU D00057]|uniref:HAD family hydrolase n=1 Tax=Naasia sp. SYSU D00057 TaxID=2817380 RepID=UPI001B3080EC|nr:HAD family phosphatase [Naasia sp. SYSU D00057]
MPFSAADADALVAAALPLAHGRAVVWDFDGVLADTEPLHAESYRAMLDDRGFAVAPDFFEELVGHTEAWIWDRLTELNPALGENTKAVLVEERRVRFLEAALAALSPSWIATALVPAFDGHAASQTVVSNGDPDVIGTLLEAWGLGERLEVARRGEGEDKRSLLLARCASPALVLEDSADFLRLARSSGAATVGVVHDYNRGRGIEADLLCEL